MKKILVIFTCLVHCLSICAQIEIVSDTLHQTKYFTFHNNMWMNLHHFFYEQASNRQKIKLAEDGLMFNEIGDSLSITELTAQEKRTYDEGVEFYTKMIIDQKLINSGRIFKWLQAQPSNRMILDTAYSKTFTDNLNSLKPLYETHFWHRHFKENRKLLNDYIDLIRKTEDKVISKMEELSGSQWKGTVRIDLTTYGNWAGAYSPDLDNIVISSIDPLMNSTIYVEFVFHESSHLLFLRKSPFRMEIFIKSKEQEIKRRRHLWHAAMFYLCGLATKEALIEHDISHELIMKEKNVFKQYYQNEKFKSILNDYYSSNIKLSEMALKILEID